MSGALRTVVLVPCHNEEVSVGAVVRGFRQALPDARIVVYDNASTDATAQRAREAGAEVRTELRKGKGEVVRRMFADIDADVYFMVDGDATYDPGDAPAMRQRLLADGLDMVVAARVAGTAAEAYRRGHTTGNLLFSKAVRALFGGDFTDVFSGYRAMSRRFVKSLPVASAGFEIETEIAAHAQRIRAATAEVPSAYGSRDDGSASKLRTYRDGLRIARTLLKLWEEMRPFQVFSLLFLALTAAALALGIPVVDEYERSGLVLRFPTAILAVSLQLAALLLLTAGVVLRNVGQARTEARRLAYLSIPPTSPDVVPHAGAVGTAAGTVARDERERQEAGRG